MPVVRNTVSRSTIVSAAWVWTCAPNSSASSLAARSSGPEQLGTKRGAKQTRSRSPAAPCQRRAPLLAPPRPPPAPSPPPRGAPPGGAALRHFPPPPRGPLPPPPPLPPAFLIPQPSPPRPRRPPAPPASRSRAAARRPPRGSDRAVRPARCSGGDPRLHRGGVVRDVEVGAQLVHQVVVGVHAREDALGAARIDEEVSERIVEARQQDGTERPVRQRYVHRVGVGREQSDPVRLERRGDLLGIVLEIVERLRPLVGAQRVGRAQPKQHHTRLRDHLRRDQRAVARVPRHEPGEVAPINRVGRPT